MLLRKVVIIILATIPAIIYTNKKLLSWELFELFTDSKFTREGLSRVENFNPDKDILYLPTLKGKNLFQAVGDLSITRKKSVRKYIYYYLTSGRKYLIRSIERSYLYEDIIQDVFSNNRDIPEELSLLPLIESSFDPNAVSESRAMGLWQFIRTTASTLGLTHNHWIDERRNVKKSTEAAVDHLRNLYGIFHSWGLVLAAYNGGAGYIKRIMDKTGVKDFWALEKSGLLRKETRDYVPKFIALLIIYKNQRLFGIRDEIDIPEKRDDGYVTLNRAVDLHRVAELTGVSVPMIKKLNPELKHDITPPSPKKYRLLLPAEGKKKLQENRNRLYTNRIRDAFEYRIKKGDTIGDIARRYRTGAGMIMRINHIRNHKALRPGKVILVPY
jgi:membrane-bound lytic murein transglycosylase D